MREESDATGHGAPVFARLQPPPGGAARLQRALASRDDGYRVPALGLAAAAVAVVALVAMALLPERSFRGQFEAALDAQLLASGRPRADGALLEWQSTDPEVRVYIVTSVAR